MQIFKTLLLAIAFFCPVFSAAAQDSGNTGKIYFVRHTGYNGMALNFHCFIDSSRVCDLKNNHYSVHEVPAGDHVVNVKIYSKELKSPKRPVTIKVEPGQVYYVKILPEKSYSFEAYLKVMTVSETTIKPVMKKCEPQTDCIL
ncbi:DUF2846 domain-containing protein [Chitinophaga sp. NPDC101104]|uniref:DUF2846 domain-containing protein n=1 Tax=Chitinophaga sp. NPDC101104 TaxID=3390561 RepID=UPI003D07CFB9